MLRPGARHEAAGRTPLEGSHRLHVLAGFPRVSLCRSSPDSRANKHLVAVVPLPNSAANMRVSSSPRCSFSVLCYCHSRHAIVPSRSGGGPERVEGQSADSRSAAKRAVVVCRRRRKTSWARSRNRSVRAQARHRTCWVRVQSREPGIGASVGETHASDASRLVARASERRSASAAAVKRARR
jgi:hypothetical protein